MKFFLIIICLFFANSANTEGYDVFSIGYFGIKLNDGATNEAVDFRYERRFDKSLMEIGPESYNFFNLKPFLGFELTSDSASYFLTGIYLDDNIGTLFQGKPSNYIFTPSFGFGIYDDGDGKKLGSTVEFRTTLEASYQFKNNNRIGFSVSHISNANIGNKNPGVEVISFSYQIPY